MATEGSNKPGTTVPTTAMITANCTMLTVAEVRSRTAKVLDSYDAPQNPSAFNLTRYSPVFAFDEVDGTSVVTKTVTNRASRRVIGVTGILNHQSKRCNIKFIGICLDDQDATDIGSGCRLLSVATSGPFTIVYRPAPAQKAHDVQKVLVFGHPTMRQNKGYSDADAGGAIHPEMYSVDDSKLAGTIDFPDLSAGKPTGFDTVRTLVGKGDDPNFWWQIVSSYVFSGRPTEAVRALHALHSANPDVKTLLKTMQQITLFSNNSNHSRRLYVTRMGKRNGLIDVLLIN